MLIDVHNRTDKLDHLLRQRTEVTSQLWILENHCFCSLGSVSLSKLISGWKGGKKTKCTWFKQYMPGAFRLNV